MRTLGETTIYAVREADDVSTIRAGEAPAPKDSVPTPSRDPGVTFTVKQPTGVRS